MSRNNDRPDRRGGEEEKIDDGRTVADMSGVEPAVSSMFGFRAFRRRRAENGRQETDVDESRRQAAEMSGKDTFRFILGAIGAGLLIGGVFIVVFGIVIWLMVTFWT